MRTFEPKPEAGRWKPPASAARDSWRAAIAGVAEPVPHRARMEQAFGRDFSDVPVHLGRGTALDALGANAATDGERVAFASYSPGPRQVAHELAHVVQMRGAAADGGRLSSPGSPAEREADRIADRAARGEPVSVSEAAPAALHRDLKSGKLEVPHGHFEIDMAKTEMADDYSGEDGHVHYTAKPTAPDSESIRLSQAVEMKDLKMRTEFDWNFEGSDEKDRNEMRTKAADRTYVTVAGDTLESISIDHFGSAAQAHQIGMDNESVMCADAPRALTDLTWPIPAYLKLKISGAEKAGYFIDHKTADRRAKKRKRARQRVVPQDYVWPRERRKRNHHGSKKGEAIREAVLYDFPGTAESDHLAYSFETVARSDDIGLYYGTLKWGFEVDATKDSPTVDKERFEVLPGVTDTFRSALVKFDSFYRNPHTVLAGQTLEKISEIYYGNADQAGAIFDHNKELIGTRNAALEPGWRLRIPKISAGTD